MVTVHFTPCYVALINIDFTITIQLITINYIDVAMHSCIPTNRATFSYNIVPTSINVSVRIRIVVITKMVDGHLLCQ